MSEQKQRAYGDFFVTVTARAYKDAEVQSFTKQDGSSFDIVRVKAVNSPYIGPGKEPETHWFTVSFIGASAKLAEKITKGTEFTVRGSLRPRTWDKSGETAIDLQVDASRDYNSLTVHRFGGNGSNGSQDSSSSGSSASDDQDVPF